MVLVTVVGEQQCRKGFEFVFGGPLGECKECKVKNVCFHLEQNRRYRVVDVRDVRHECKIHEGGVRVVEVEKVSTKAAIPKKSAVEGATVAFEESECDFLGCPNFRLCRPWGAVEGMKFKIATVDKEVDCPKGKKLMMVLLD